MPSLRLLALSSMGAAIVTTGIANPMSAAAETNPDQGNYTTGGVIFSVVVCTVLASIWIGAVAWIFVKRRDDDGDDYRGA